MIKTLLLINTNFAADKETFHSEPITHASGFERPMNAQD